MSSLKINSKTEITDVYHKVIQDVIKNMKDVFKEENVSHFVLKDLESLWTSKFLNTREKTLPVTLVPMKIMVPFKKSPSAESVIREIELMVPHHEAELLDFRKVFTEGIMNAVVYLSNRVATMFLQQHVNKFLVSKDQVEDMIYLKEIPQENMEQDPLGDSVTMKTEQLNDAANEEPFDEVVTISEEPFDDLVTIKEEAVICEVPQADGAYDSSSDDDDSSDDSKSSSSQKSPEDVVDPSIYGSEGESLNSDDDVTDEDIETLFDSDNVILCQYIKVLRCKNKWRFYFKDGVMNLNGCDYAFHKILGDAPW